MPTVPPPPTGAQDSRPASKKSTFRMEASCVGGFVAEEGRSVLATYEAEPAKWRPPKCSDMPRIDPVGGRDGFQEREGGKHKQLDTKYGGRHSLSTAAARAHSRRPGDRATDCNIKGTAVGSHGESFEDLMAPRFTLLLFGRVGDSIFGRCRDLKIVRTTTEGEPGATYTVSPVDGRLL